MSNEEQIADFAESLARKPATQRAYMIAMKSWAAWLAARPEVERDFTRENAQAWISHLTGTSKADNTIATYANAIRRFFRWRDGVKISLESPSQKFNKPEYHDPKDIYRMMDLAGPRDRAFIGVMFNSACRISEILTAPMDGINRSQSSIRVRRKGGAEEDAVLLDDGMQILDQWLEKRSGISKYIFFDYFEGDTLEQKAGNARRQISQLAKKAGIREKFTPHHLRHSKATELLGKGVPLSLVSEVLGHKNLNVTAKIYTRLIPKDRKAKVEEEIRRHKAGGAQ